MNRIGWSNKNIRLTYRRITYGAITIQKFNTINIDKSDYNRSNNSILARMPRKFALSQVFRLNLKIRERYRLAIGKL